VCSQLFVPKGPAGRYCETCSKIKYKEAKVREIRARAIMPGVGKGGYPHRGEAHPRFKHGRYTYETTRHEIKQARRYCERCEKDLDAAVHYQWVIHHRDHNQYNYHIGNLELLCTSCHLIEHGIKKPFEGATTIPEGSTFKRVEAPSPEQSGDDIV